jgi:hypothetical protein
MQQILMFVRFFFCFSLWAFLSDCVTINCPKCYRGAGRGPPSSIIWWWEGVTWCSINAMVQGACAHVAGARYFLGLAVMQACGDQVVPGARSGAMAKVWRLGHNNLLLGALALMTGRFVGTSASLGLTTVGIGIRSEATQTCGGQVAPAAHRQWRKLVETEPGRGCQMGLRLAAHTTARSNLQPLPPTDFSLQITDLMCESVSPMQCMGQP